MAFATANLRSGVNGDLKLQAGDWSGSEGDAAGTFSLRGGRVYRVHFGIQDSDSGKDRPVPTSVSITSGAITVTIFNHVTVTNGRFIIEYA